MANFKKNPVNTTNPFATAEHVASERPAACAVCEAMLPEAVDGSLSASEQRAFDAHLASCVACQQELAEARRGAAWLTLLKQQEPEPPATLLARILEQTSGADVLKSSPIALPAESAATMARQPAFYPAAQAAATVGLGRRLSDWFGVEAARMNLQALLQPRFAMTAAMAFFSIAVTLNLMGVQLQNVRASSFTPAGIRRTAAQASASVTRSVVNNRSVYQMESRLNDLRNDDAGNDHGPR